MCRIGVISDTHRLIRPEALTALEGVGHIIHAGDIGSADVISELREIAPVTAIRGNVDVGDWASELPKTAVVELGGITIYVIHSIGDLDLDPRTSEFSAVVYGHSHAPLQHTKDGVLFFNPGSAGPGRFNLPVSMGFLTIRNKNISGEFIYL